MVVIQLTKERAVLLNVNFNSSYSVVYILKITRECFAVRPLCLVATDEI